MSAQQFGNDAVSNPTIRARNARSARLQAPSLSNTAADADHALANIRAWTDMLVARGNRLLELAVRERESLAGITLGRPSSRDGEAAGARRSERAGKEIAGLRAKPLA